MTFSKFVHFTLILLLLVSPAQSAFASAPCGMELTSNTMSMMVDMAEMHKMPQTSEGLNAENTSLDCCSEDGCVVSSCISSIMLSPEDTEFVSIALLTDNGLYRASYTSFYSPPPSPPPIFR